MSPPTESSSKAFGHRKLLILNRIYHLADPVAEIKKSESICLVSPSNLCQAFQQAPAAKLSSQNSVVQAAMSIYSSTAMNSSSNPVIISLRYLYFLPKKTTIRSNWKKRLYITWKRRKFSFSGSRIIPKARFNIRLTRRGKIRLQAMATTKKKKKTSCSIEHIHLSLTTTKTLRGKKKKLLTCQV